jgi:uncharacterized protein (TIGR00730 family)
MKNLSVGVFCSASHRLDSMYLKLAFQFGKTLAQKGYQVVYGGASIGMMGELANGALSENGHVVGVIPEFIKEKEIAHTKIAELVTTQNMHERKEKMYQRSDCFVSLPGGFGTLDESFEVITWNQLKVHQKHMYFYNFNSFYDFMDDYIQMGKKQRFIGVHDQYFPQVVHEEKQLLEYLAKEEKKINESK